MQEVRGGGAEGLGGRVLGGGVGGALEGVHGSVSRPKPPLLLLWDVLSCTPQAQL